MPDEVTYYRCVHCSRYTRRLEKRVLEHETHCFDNPKRTPYKGEITQFWQFMHHCGYVSYDDDDYYLTEEKPLPSWWPHKPNDGVGYIWDGSQWLKVTDYEDGIWPDIDGKSLPQIPAHERVMHIDALTATKPQTAGAVLDGVVFSDSFVFGD